LLSREVGQSGGNVLQQQGADGAVGDVTPPTRRYMFTPLNGLLTRPISIINADGEVFISADTPAEDYNFSFDPAVAKDFTVSGAPNWLTYWSTWRTRLTTGIRDAFMTDPTLAKGVLKGTKFTMYQVQGTNGYFGNWTQTRTISTPMMNGQTGKESHYSTNDLSVYFYLFPGLLISFRL
jgi:hypothetical protein